MTVSLPTRFLDISNYMLIIVRSEDSIRVTRCETDRTVHRVETGRLDYSDVFFHQSLLFFSFNTVYILSFTLSDNDKTVSLLGLRSKERTKS